MKNKAFIVSAVCAMAAAGSAHAYRPFDGTDADVASAGEVEFELGYLRAVREGRQDSLLAPVGVINFGLRDERELVVEGRFQTPLNRDTDPHRTTFEDGAISVKQIHRRGALQGESGPSVASECGVLLATVTGERTGAGCAGIISLRGQASTVHLNGALGKNRDGHWEQFFAAIVEGSGALRPVAEIFATHDGSGRHAESVLALKPRQWRTVLITWFLFMAGATAGPPDSGGEHPGRVVMKHIADYPLPGRATRWDYMSFDALRSRLFISHLGDSEVVAFDTRSKTMAGTVADVGDVHGTLAIPELGRVYATATKTNELVAIDADTLKILARIPTGRHPDGLAYAPDVHKVYVSDEYGKTETVVDVQTNKRVATIPLGGEVGNTQYDSQSGHIFVNVQGTGELVEIDPARDEIVRRIPVSGANGNHGLLIEPRYRFAFIANEGNDRLLVLDLNGAKVSASFQVGKGPDVLAYDQALGMLYVASESGVLSQFRVDERGVSKLGQSFAGANAHTVAVTPDAHEIYLPLKETGKRPVLRAMQPIPLNDR